MDSVIPNIDWCREISLDLNVPTRCPFGSVERCPRYYQSISLLGNAGYSSIPIKKDKRLLKKWQKSDLWSIVSEQETSVSGKPNKKKILSKFCPEVSFDSFGFFASEIYPYSEELDQDNGIKYGAKLNLPSEHWIYDWSYVEKMHYTDCPLYSPIQNREIQKSQDLNHVDKIIGHIKNNRVAALIIIVSIFLIALGKLTDSFSKIQTWISSIFRLLN